MSASNPENLPKDLGDGEARGRDPRAFYIENLHYHPNDMSELRRIAERDPLLARAIVDSNSEATRLMDGSYRLGLIVAAIFASVLALGAVVIVVTLGWWQTLIFAVAMLAVGHLLRVVLTGEWSDTSWLSSILKTISGDKKRDD